MKYYPLTIKIMDDTIKKGDKYLNHGDIYALIMLRGFTLSMVSLPLDFVFFIPLSPYLIYKTIKKKRKIDKLRKKIK